MSSKKNLKNINNDELTTINNNLDENIIVVEKTYEEKLIDVKTTIVNMFHKRGFINKSNVKKITEKLISEILEEYIIPLDNDENYNSKIPDKEIYVKIFNSKITSISKDTEIGQYITSDDRSKKYKFIVVEDINSRTEKNINMYDNQIEIYKFTNLQQDITLHRRYSEHIPLTKEEIEAFLVEYNAKPINLPQMYNTDPVAKYFNMKVGDIFKVNRISTVTGTTPYYWHIIYDPNN